MSILRNLGSVLRRRPSEGAARPFATPTPLGLHQGSAVEFDPTLRILHEVGGGALPEFDPTQVVAAVGRLAHSGREWFRSYLSGGKAFVETVPDPADRSRAVQVRLWVEEREILPSTPEQWRDLLDDREGLVGWSGFQLDATESRAAIVYGRAWSPGGPQRVRPVEATEAVADASGASTSLRHRMMLYSRPLGGGGSEHLLADVVEGPDGASLDVHVGVDLTPSQFQVFPAGAGR